MHDTAFLRRPGALTDLRVDDPHGRIATEQAPVMATPGLVVGMAVGYALLNAFEAGKGAGGIQLPQPG
ncbi:hypothetical protein [Nonomuraea sp. NPDC050310]|uniref:hypothetical protein n=1 Tax=unclassified Nonomuraea TaxID=2593643 RepID=UPI00340F43CB